VSSQPIAITVFVKLEENVQRCSDRRERNQRGIDSGLGPIRRMVPGGNSAYYYELPSRRLTNLKLAHEALELWVFSKRIPPGLDFEEDHPA